VSSTSVLDPEPPDEDMGSSLQQQWLYEADERWRQEIASRVDAFCARRGRKRVPRTPSLSLDFERAARATVAAHYAVPEPHVDPAPQPTPEPDISNVIEFPRPLEAPPLSIAPMPEELAEPIIEKPRILDAEEPSGLWFGSESRPPITLESAPEPEPGDDAGLVGESASLSRRIFAAALDSSLVVIALAVFATVFLHIAGAPPRWRTALMMAGSLAVLFWAMYQYLFLVYAAATPGMRAAGLHVCTFDNLPARRSLRRWRAIAMMVSGMGLGLGFLWAAIDDYGLCWHDRITQTTLRC
jgi:uncharacterized RDD family membrane protein YckC